MLSYVKIAEMTIKTAKSNSSNVYRLVAFYACYSLCTFALSPNLVPRVGTRLPIPAPMILVFKGGGRCKQAKEVYFMYGGKPLAGTSKAYDNHN